ASGRKATSLTSTPGNWNPPAARPRERTTKTPTSWTKAPPPAPTARPSTTSRFDRRAPLTEQARPSPLPFRGTTPAPQNRPPPKFHRALPVLRGSIAPHVVRKEADPHDGAILRGAKHPLEGHHAPVPPGRLPRDVLRLRHRCRAHPRQHAAPAANQPHGQHAPPP